MHQKVTVSVINNNENNNHSAINKNDDDCKSASLSLWPKNNLRLNKNDISIDNSCNNSSARTTKDNNLSEEHHLVVRMSFGMFRKDRTSHSKRTCNIIEDAPQEDLNIEHFIFQMVILTKIVQIKIL